MTTLHNLAKIGTILGHAVNAEYLTTTLRVEPTKREKRSLLYDNDGVIKILDAHAKQIADAKMVFLAELADDDEL